MEEVHASIDNPDIVDLVSQSPLQSESKDRSLNLEDYDFDFSSCTCTIGSISLHESAENHIWDGAAHYHLERSVVVLILVRIPC